jgi:hypothetical protein
MAKIGRIYAIGDYVGNPPMPAHFTYGAGGADVEREMDDISQQMQAELGDTELAIHMPLVWNYETAGKRLRDELGGEKGVTWEQVVFVMDQIAADINREAENVPLAKSLEAFIAAGALLHKPPQLPEILESLQRSIDNRPGDGTISVLIGGNNVIVTHSPAYSAPHLDSPRTEVTFPDVDVKDVFWHFAQTYGASRCGWDVDIDPDCDKIIHFTFYLPEPIPESVLDTTFESKLDLKQ